MRKVIGLRDNLDLPRDFNCSSKWYPEDVLPFSAMSKANARLLWMLVLLGDKSAIFNMFTGMLNFWTRMDEEFSS